MRSQKVSLSRIDHTPNEQSRTRAIVGTRPHHKKQKLLKKAFMKDLLANFLLPADLQEASEDENKDEFIPDDEEYTEKSIGDREHHHEENAEVKREFESEEEEQEDAENHANSFATSLSHLRAVLSAEGPIVSVVFLRTNGTAEEKLLDMTPRKQAIGSELGSNTLSFLGQFQSLNVVILQRRDQMKDIPLNCHNLPAPFSGSIGIRGDLALVRMNRESIPESFTLKEWKAFVSEGGKTEEANTVYQISSIKRRKQI